MQEIRNALGCIMPILHYGSRPTRDTRRTELKMSMQCLRETLDAREFETRLVALRNSRTQLDARNLAEIEMLRNRIDECDEIARLIRDSTCLDQAANCVASSVANAIIALDRYQESMGGAFDTTTQNDGTIDAWGWTDETPDGEMSWRATIRIIEETDL